MRERIKLDGKYRKVMIHCAGGELEGYIKGGDKTLREAYGHIPKPKARKIRDYLYSILEDAWQYEKERRPGRKAKPKKQMKSK